MDSKRLILRIEWIGITFVVLGLYVQSFYYEFMLRVMGAIMILIGIIVLAFILGAKLGEGKDAYKNSNAFSYYSRSDNIRKLQGLDDGRH